MRVDADSVNEIVAACRDGLAQPFFPNNVLYYEPLRHILSYSVVCSFGLLHLSNLSMTRVYSPPIRRDLR